MKTNIGLGCLIAICLAIAETGCNEKTGRQTKAESLKSIDYDCVIPAGLDQKIELKEKAGSPITANAHAIYRQCHAEGWNGVMKHYAMDGTPDYRPESVQEWGIHNKAREIGMAEARILLMKMELVMPVDDIKKRIREHYDRISTIR